MGGWSVTDEMSRNCQKNKLPNSKFEAAMMQNNKKFVEIFFLL